jgi:hypothetical protein
MNGNENKSGAGWAILVLLGLGIGAVAIKNQNTNPSAAGDGPVSVPAERERYPDSMLEDLNENARRWRENNGQTLPAKDDGLTAVQIKAAMDKAYLDYKMAENAGDQVLAAKKYEEYTYWWNRLNARRQ